jgi:tetratricopeptide (TPR) repeat protein/predicted Ser/Thr protein kinase
MAVVYRAHDRELGRDVALKLLNGAEDAPQGNVRLLREAQALAQLAHPNVIQIYDVGRFADGVFLAMELVEGKRLDDWIRERPRTVREVLPIFREAARGLSAAHARGIVHRDFKPSNVILGSDGRTRVLDFGLARAADPEGKIPVEVTAQNPDQNLRERPDNDNTAHETTAREPRTETTAPVFVESNAPQKPMELQSSKSLLDSPLTQAGALVGTPPYMAPEQHAGRCDARSDQFSFCVAFWFALYGERPFGGLNYDDLKANMAAGKIRTPPAARAVPSWINKILARGLSALPEDRFPSMDALLEALDRDPARARNRAALTVGIVLVAGVGAFGWLRAPGCRDAAERLKGVWDAAKKSQIETAFAATRQAFANDAFSSVSRAFDDYATQWAALQGDACRARGEQSGELFDLRMSCLDERLEQLRAQVAEFASADADLVERAGSVARSLPPLGNCANVTALRAPVQPDAKQKKRVESLRKELARVRALWQSGRYDKAAPPSESAVKEAQAIGYRPLEAEALLMRARVEDARGKYLPAEKTFRDARVAAEAGRADEVAALATTGLVWVVGERQGHYSEARELGREAQAKIERAGNSPILLAELEAKLSAISLEEGKFDDSLAHANQAIALREKSLPPDDPALASSLGDRADVLQQLGKYDAAVADYRHALAIDEKVLGPNHPAIASLLVNLSSARRDHLDEALADLRRAESIARALGPKHPLNANIAVDLGSTLMEKGDLDGAAKEYRLARSLWSELLGPDHPNVATVDFHMGELAMKRGHPEEAAAQFQRVLKSWEKSLGPDHPSLSAPLDGLGDAMMAQHKAADAVEYYARALTLLKKAVGPDHPDTRRTQNLLDQARKFR